MTESFSGKPPRDSDSIRKFLQSIHENAPLEVPQGPRPEGAQASDEIVVETFHDARVARQAQQALLAAGVAVTRDRRGSRICLAVGYRDHELANEILTRFKSEHPDRPPTGIRRDYDFLIFGAAIGASVGLLMIVVAQQLRMLMLAAGLALLGAMFGHLLDRIRGNSGPSGKLRITVYEWMLGVAVLALLLSMRQLMTALGQ